MPHALTPHTGERDLDAASITHDPLVLDPLVFSTGTLPILSGTEDALAEETALFRFKGTIVDRLGVFHFPTAPGSDGVRAGNRDLNLIKAVGFAIQSVDFI